MEAKIWQKFWVVSSVLSRNYPKQVQNFTETECMGDNSTLKKGDFFAVLKIWMNGMNEVWKSVPSQNQLNISHNFVSKTFWALLADSYIWRLKHEIRKIGF